MSEQNERPTEIVCFRATPSHKRAMEERARAEDRPLSSWLRRVLKEAEEADEQEED